MTLIEDFLELKEILANYSIIKLKHGTMMYILSPTAHCI
jgi:hypothetical protein